MQECKQKVTKVISLVKLIITSLVKLVENLPSVSGLLKIINLRLTVFLRKTNIFS